MFPADITVKKLSVNIRAALGFMASHQPGLFQYAYQLDGLTNGITLSSPISMAIDDIIEMTYRGVNSNNAYGLIIKDAGWNAALGVSITDVTAWQYLSLYVDDVVISWNAPLPNDGKSHVLKMVVTTPFNMTAITDNTNPTYQLYDIKLTRAAGNISIPLTNKDSGAYQFTKPINELSLIDYSAVNNTALPLIFNTDDDYLSIWGDSLSLPAGRYYYVVEAEVLQDSLRVRLGTGYADLHAKGGRHVYNGTIDTDGSLQRFYIQAAYGTDFRGTIHSVNVYEVTNELYATILNYKEAGWVKVPKPKPVIEAIQYAYRLDGLTQYFQLSSSVPFFEGMEFKARITLPTVASGQHVVFYGTALLRILNGNWDFPNGSLYIDGVLKPKGSAAQLDGLARDLRFVAGTSWPSPTGFISRVGGSSTEFYSGAISKVSIGTGISIPLNNKEQGEIQTAIDGLGEELWTLGDKSTVNATGGTVGESPTTIAVETGATYIVRYKCSNFLAGRIGIYTGAGALVSADSDGDYVDIVTTDSSVLGFIVKSNPTTVTISNISVKKLTKPAATIINYNEAGWEQI